MIRAILGAIVAALLGFFVLPFLAFAVTVFTAFHHSSPVLAPYLHHAH